MISSGPDKKPGTHVDEDFLSRWSRRKRQTLDDQQQSQESTAASVDNNQTHLPTDADMPPIESLTDESDYSGFLSPKVSEALRKQALRKLFHSPAFNICDGLDDYDGDYTKFATLGNIVTADMKHQIEMEARRQMQALADAEPQTENENAEVSAATPSENSSAAAEQIHADANDTNVEAPIDDNDGVEDQS